MKLSPFDFVLEHENWRSLSFEEVFFSRALENAQFCAGITHPNPCVGAVIARDDKFLSAGYTRPAGGMHAEIDAIKNAHEDLSGSTLYVTLEPCSHIGRTPPCTDAIKAAKISKVIFGAGDPNPKVNGKGIHALTSAGIEVEQVRDQQMKAMAAALILPFKTWIAEERPYTIVKVATSADGKIAARLGERTKITGPKADVITHRLRRHIDAVVVGANTVRIDDPMLTARLSEKGHGAQPMRVVLASDLDFDRALKIFDLSLAKTVILTREGYDAKRASLFIDSGIPVIGCPATGSLIDLRTALKTLARLGITSIMFEPGGKLLESLLAQELADEFWWFTSSISFEGDDGLAAPGLNADGLEGFTRIAEECMGDDRLTIWQRP